jgi:hypothetical protein
MKFNIKALCAVVVAIAATPIMSQASELDLNGAKVGVGIVPINSCVLKGFFAKYSSPFSATLKGFGHESVETSASTIQGEVTSDLRVQIIPQAAPQSYGTSEMPSSELAAEVTLIDNGVVVASIDLPAQLNQGIQFGAKSTIADFSAYLVPGGHYSIQVSNVRTDYVCKNFCTQQEYPNSPSELAACQAMNCNVGPAIPEEAWQVEVRIETDQTPCL